MFCLPLGVSTHALTFLGSSPNAPWAFPRDFLPLGPILASANLATDFPQHLETCLQLARLFFLRSVFLRNSLGSFSSWTISSTPSRWNFPLFGSSRRVLFRLFRKRVLRSSLISHPLLSTFHVGVFDVPRTNCFLRLYVSDSIFSACQDVGVHARAEWPRPFQPRSTVMVTPNLLLAPANRRILRLFSLGRRIPESSLRLGELVVRRVRIHSALPCVARTPLSF